METPFHLNGKTILISGASSGIGRQTAIDCARMGATLVLTGRSEERLAETKGQLAGDGHIYICCDLLDEQAIKTLATECPALDGIVHAAGIVKPFPVQYLGFQKIAETFHSNFYTSALLTATLFKQKKVNDGGALVFISSISAQYPNKGNSMYAASKAAMESFAKSVASEYGHKGIRANSISPAMVKTPMYDYTSEGAFKPVMDAHVGKYPLGIGYPEDVANAVIFLLSPASRWITGTNIIMDGGYISAC